MKDDGISFFGLHLAFESAKVSELKFDILPYNDIITIYRNNFHFYLYISTLNSALFPGNRSICMQFS